MDNDHLWTTSDVADHLGASSIQSAAKTLSRWGIKPISREPGRGGQNLYDPEQIKTASSVRPGRGARTDLHTLEDTMNQALDPAAIMAEAFDTAMIHTGRAYRESLPEDLEPWHCYIVDSGHCIAIVPQSVTQVPDPGYLCPAPVKAVLRAGWEMVDGFVVCDLPYDPDLGLVVDDADTDFEH